MRVLNPGFLIATQPQMPAQQAHDTIQPTNVLPDGTVENVVVAANQRNQETDLRGEGLGDYVAGSRPTTLAHPST
jgi:hypothetical protein